MGKVKVKKADVWIDMTPMSDVMVLLLTFFMLTSTFVKNEAVKVVTPGSVSEIKVPETNVLTVLCDKNGRIIPTTVPKRAVRVPSVTIVAMIGMFI